MRTLPLAIEAYRQASQALAEAIDAFAKPNPPTQQHIEHLRAVRDAWARDYREALQAQRGSQRAIVQPA